MKINTEALYKVIDLKAQVSVIGPNVVAERDAGGISLYLYSTRVIWWDTEKSIRVTTGGYNTRLTCKAIESLARVIGVPVKASIRGGEIAINGGDGVDVLPLGGGVWQAKAAA